MPTSPVASPLRVAILGASGYTGAELIRLLHTHPQVTITALTADSQAGKTMAEVYPHLAHLALPPLTTLDAVEWGAIDLVFCCLPHATTQTVIAALPAHLTIIDLSADFRLRDPALYAEWYGHEHQATALQAEAVYGLSEHARAAIAKARLIANPGCYPTCSALPLMPLLAAQLIANDGIVIDAKSGVSGAGRAVKQASLFAEVNEGLSAYGVGHHRHMPEIEQALSDAAGAPVTVRFTPHLVPMNRGMLTTIYATRRAGVRVEQVHAHLAAHYANEPFVHILPLGQVPATQQVRGSNLCLIGVAHDRVEGGVILVSVIDNLVKGASGQAVQNMNIRFGFPETLGLTGLALFP